MTAEIANPSRTAPSSQTMENSSFSPPPNAAVAADSDTDDHSSSHDHSNRSFRSSALSRNLDIPSSNSLKSEEYRQLFRLPFEEVLVQDFNCALQENILLQGHMYLFDHYICFYSNIFGFESKKIIPLQDVTSVRRAKTAGIFPNAIEIVAASKKHIFASFLSRDEAYRLIVDGWSQNDNEPNGLSDRQDSKSEIGSQLNGVGSIENGNTSDSPANERESDERNSEVSRSGDTEISPNHVDDDDVRPTSQEIPDIKEEKQDAVSAEGPSTSSSVNWKQENIDAPEVSKSFTLAGESKFQISVEQFFNYFFSDDGIGFVESYHKACGDRDFKCSSWTPCEDSGFVREKSFLHPIKVYFGAKCGGCKETQKYRVYKNSHLFIATSQEVSDVPYADYFTVEGAWDVQKDDNESQGCILRVYVRVTFSKKTIWKGKIEQSTMEECRETYATWIDLAHKLIKQKNSEEIGGKKVEGGQIGHKNTKENGDCAERSHVNADAGTTTETVTKTLSNKPTGKLLQGSLQHVSTIADTMKSLALNFFSFLKNRGNLQQFLVISLCIILLLMQISIVVLLNRPQQVHVISQADHFSSVGSASGQRAAEAMAWMEKRVHLLNDEMLVVEGQLERMRHEHITLKAQLKDLQHLIKQQQ
ncbi:hypothetical protein vseg_018916 [Gypsophila vaccaria]